MKFAAFLSMLAMPTTMAKIGTLRNMATPLGVEEGGELRSVSAEAKSVHINDGARLLQQKRHAFGSIC